MEKIFSCNGFVNMPLFKYYSNINYATDCIKEQKIHLEHPYDYNDLFDCAVTIDETSFDQLGTSVPSMIRDVIDALPQVPANDEIDINNIINTLNDNHHAPLFSNVINATVTELERLNLILTAEEIKTELIAKWGGSKLVIPSNIKVSCFSEVCNSIPMWSYYANNHTGVCLRYDFPIEAIKKDKYVKGLNKVNYVSSYSKRFEFNDRYFCKSSDWQHEREWRLVCEQDDDFIIFPYLTGVYLGSRFNKQDKSLFDIISLKLKYNFDLYMLRPNPFTYGLEAVCYKVRK